MMLKATRKQVAICGDGCLNVVLEITRHLQRGTNADVLRTVRRPGGNALVTSLVLAGWGTPVKYIGVIGRDANGNDLTEWTRKAGLNTDAVIRRGTTRTSYAIVDPEERTIFDERSDGMELSISDWQETKAIGQAIADADLVMVDRYCSAIHELVIDEITRRRLKRIDTMLAYRTGSRPSEGTKTELHILASADICFTKRPFLSGLGLSESAQLACKQVSLQFGVPVVVATLGPEGAAYYDRNTNESATLPAKSLTSFKTSLGGGDFFRAGFIFANLKGKSISESVRAGNDVAARHCSAPESDDPSLFSLPFEEKVL